MITSVKGTQDFLDLTLFNFAIDGIKKHLARHNFSEIRTPIIEPTELFKRSLGLTSDVVSKQMYTFGEEQELCLRPEATASVVRAFNEHHVQQTPWKVFLWGSMFRHERPQKGRFREFHQVSMEIIGSAAVAQDALFIYTLDTLFRHVFKLESYALYLNYLGTVEDRLRHKEALVKFLEANMTTICATCQERKNSNPLRVFDCKSEQCQELYKQAPKILDYLSQQSQQEWDNLKKQLDLLSVNYVITPGLVRGLDYYNKTVFEFMSLNLGAQNAFCGGGRYDSLVKEIGGEQDQACIGAAIGIERLLMLLEPIKNNLALPQPHALTVIIPLEEQQQTLALLLADNLLNSNKCVDVILDDASVKSKMRKANKMGATWAVIIGPDEQAQKTAVLKNMVNGQEKTVSQITLAQEI